MVHTRATAGRLPQALPTAPPSGAGVAAALAEDPGDLLSLDRLLTRRLLPAAAALLAVIGAMGWLGYRSGLYPADARLVITMALSILASVWLIIAFARFVRRVEAQRGHLERRYQRLVEQLPLVVYIDDLADTSHLYTSPQVEALLGYPVAAWAANRDLFVELLHPDDRERVLRELREASAGDAPFRSEYRLIARDGRVVWLRDERVLVHDEEGRSLYAQGYLLDVTDRRLAEARLQELAYHDTLTGLANRGSFLEHLRRSLEEQPQDLSVVFLDLDDFKTVNDSLGHGAGDEMLRLAAGRLRSTVRETDVVARLGGDEFAVLVGTADKEALGQLMRRLRNALRTPTTLAGRTLTASASIGVACAPDSDDLLRDADLAMYAAKNAGGDRACFFVPAMHDTVVERLDMVADLQRPEILDELRLEYQPTFQLASSEITSVEALLRWERPGRGLVPPLDFVPVAEETGVILPIGAWVLVEACTTVAGWNARRATPLALSVNLSARQLQGGRLVEDVSAALARSGLRADLLTLELTESMLMASEDVAADTLARLKQLGVRLAIDDFGTGYSSFSYLRRLSVDVLKIDKSFLGRVSVEADRSLVRGIVELSKALGVELVAEGIEREDQLRLLRELRCGYGQGFLLAPPLPRELVEPLLAANAAGAPGLRVVGA